MKILLVYPNRFEEKDKRKFLRLPPLNLLTLAGLTPKDVEIEILDDRYYDIDFDQKVDAVGITGITCNAPRAYQIADEFRKRGVPVILGGSHFTFMTEEALKHADSLVVGEAEGVWEKVITDLRKRNLQRKYQAPCFSDLSKVPLPRWDLLPERNRYLTFLQTSRGCPNDCDFCSVTKFSGRKVRCRPVAKVIKEIKEVQKRLRKRLVIFVDDNIFANSHYAKTLFKALIPLKIYWGSETSLNFLWNTELVKLAAQSGCKALFLGIESVCQSALDKMGKGFNKVKEYKEVVRKLHHYGIAVIASMMLGSDEEDKTIFQTTHKILRKIDVDAAIFAITTPLPGTRLYQQLEREERIFEKDWSKFDALHPTFCPKKMTIKELEEGHVWVWKKFYSFWPVLRRSLKNLFRCPFMILVNLGYMIAVRKIWWQ